MIYILYYKFKHTANNHAGMAYLANFLKANNENVKLICHISQERAAGRYIGLIYSYLFLTPLLLFRLRKGDKIFFMEYLTYEYAYQDRIAACLRFFGKKNIFLGMVHLSGSHLTELYGGTKNIVRRLNYLNGTVVMGSSLKLFIENIGFEGKVFKSFHYVDTGYYRPLSLLETRGALNVVFVGNLKRNFEQLKEIVIRSGKDIHFDICVGNSKIDLGLSSFKNVELHGYLDESELLFLMQQCHVNLSVMDDTIGSNAITTGLAVGLAQVTSDVGSIRDYCDESNSFFCQSTDDFLESINILASNPKLLVEIRLNAVKRANELSMERFEKDFHGFFNN